MTEQDRQKHFTPHTLVTWDKKSPHFDTVKRFAESAGEGPFIVTKTDDVHPESQPVVGHDQFVQFDVKGALKTFTGAVLIRYGCV